MLWLLIYFISISSQTIPEIQTETQNKINSFYNEYILPTKIDSLITELLDYFQSINDKYHYSIFSTSSSYSRFFYETAPNVLLKDYTIAYANTTNFQFYLIINPCQNFEEYCCEDLAECVEEHEILKTKKILKLHIRLIIFFLNVMKILIKIVELSLKYICQEMK
jgi:hypothetical protein